MKYWQLWVNPHTGQLEAAIELSNIKADGSFTTPRLYVIQGRYYLDDYTNWDYWAEYGDY